MKIKKITKVKDQDLQKYQNYSWAFINVPKNVSNKLKDFQDKISEEELFVKKEGEWTYGLEDEYHITVKWGLHTNDPDELRNIIEKESGGLVELGDVDLFENDEYDVVKVNVFSSDLRRLNKKISDNMKVTDTHPSYRPHMTIAYLKHGEGKKYVGDDFFKGMSFEFDEIFFEDKRNNKSRIELFS